MKSSGSYSRRADYLDKIGWTNPRSGSRVPHRRRPTTTIVLAATDSDWIIRRSRRIIVEVCAKKLPCELAEREVPDAVAPTHSTASRNLFATLAESFWYFKCPEKYNTHK